MLPVTRPLPVTTTSPTIPDYSHVSAAADSAAAANVLQNYQNHRPPNTLRAQAADLEKWGMYLTPLDPSLANCDWQGCLPCWRHVTAGLVQGFQSYLLANGQSIATTNRALATVKRYCQLAAVANIIPSDRAERIRCVTGLHGKDARNLDTQRPVTRVGRKKANWTQINESQRAALYNLPDSPLGRRDKVIVTLLCELGLRVGELVRLTVEGVSIEKGRLTVYRPKTDLWQTHALTTTALTALTRYLQHDQHAASGNLLLGSRKGGKLQGGMSEQAVNERIGVLGDSIGVPNLSPHDLRHDWATRASVRTPVRVLQEAGGWRSPAMPLRYAAAGAIANEGVILA